MEVNIKTSIILPCWIKNEELYELTVNTLNSLAETATPEGDELESIIIDNGSVEGINVMFENSALYLRSQINRGYSWAVNQGIKLASESELVCLANNDIKVTQNWLITAQEIFKSDPRIGSVHFKMVEYNQPFVLGGNVWATGKERWCTSSFFVARRQLFDEIGLFDERYGLGGYEDYDFHKRMYKAGWKTAYTNAAAYQHKDSSTSNLRDPNERTESDKRGRELFKKLYGEYPDVDFAKNFPKQMEAPWRPFP